MAVTQNNLPGQALAAHMLAAGGIDQILTAKAIWGDITTLVRQHRDLRDMIIKAYDRNALAQLCMQLQRLPQLLERLSLLKQQLPDHYNHSLFSAVLGPIIAHHMEETLSYQGEVFLAGLCQCLGVLGLPVEVTQAPESLTHKKKYQLYPLYTKAILSTAQMLPVRIMRACEEAQERCDGSGFPECKTEEFLSQSGQIISLTNLLWPIMSQHLWPANRNLAHAVHIVQAIEGAHTSNVKSGFRNAIRRAGLADSNMTAEADLPELIEHAQASSEHLNLCYTSLYGVVTLLPTGTESLSIDACRRAMEQIHVTIQSAGVLSSEHDEWLKELADTPGELTHAAHELELSMLLHVAIRFELNRILNSLKLIQASKRRLIDEASSQLIEQSINNIADYEQANYYRRKGAFLW